MIAGIDSQADIDLYLDPEELRRLSDSKIEGILIKTERPKRQGTISISFNDARKNENGFGVGLDDERYWEAKDNFHIEVFIGHEFYRDLVERGRIGTRQRMLDGSKIHIYDRSRIDNVTAMSAETLEFYRDNKERLPKEFE